MSKPNERFGMDCSEAQENMRQTSTTNLTEILCRKLDPPERRGRDLYLDSQLPLEMRKICQVQWLRENLEYAKNRNRILRKLLCVCNCGLTAKSIGSCSSLTRKDAEELSWDSDLVRNLTTILKIVQSKCQLKDAMIAVLAEKLNRNITPDQANRILCDLAQYDFRSARFTPPQDFDRVTLWKYLTRDNAYENESENENENGNEPLFGNSPFLAPVCFAIVAIYLGLVFGFCDSTGILIAVHLLRACYGTLNSLCKIIWRVCKLLQFCQRNSLL